MLQGWVVIAVALAYIGLLFLIASYGDRTRGLGRDGRPISYDGVMRVLCLSLLLALPACQIIGDPMDSNAGATDTTTEGPDQSTTTTTTDGAVTTTEGTTSEGTTTEAQPTTTSGTTGPADMCQGLDQAECAVAEGCRSVVGTPLDFAGCNPLPAYLGCAVEADCDLADR